MPNDDRPSVGASLKKGFGLFLFLLILFSGLTWVALAADADLRFAGLFYDLNGGWVHAKEQPWQALYAYGTLPGLVLILAALTVLFLGFWIPRLNAYRSQMLVVVLTGLLGAGLLVNAILKPYTGRPRPRHVEQFGGQWEYCLPCGSESIGRGMSFPCGHCTMGFLFMTLMFCWPKSRLLAIGGGLFGLAYGSLLGVARAAQGAHFVTDTLWSLGVMLMVAVLVQYVLLPLVNHGVHLSRRLSRTNAWLVGFLLLVTAAAATTAFLTRRPYYEVWEKALPGTEAVRQVIVKTELDVTRAQIRTSDERPFVRVQAQGFGWIEAEEKLDVTVRVRGSDLIITLTGTPKGYFAELNHEVIVGLPQSHAQNIRLQMVPPHE